MGAVDTARTPGIEAVREREFPIVREYTYLNIAAQGPWPTRTVRAVERFGAASQFPGIKRADAEPPAEPHARASLARLIGAREDELVFTGNTTHGMNICAQGIAWQPGDNAVVPAREFPSLVAAWAHLRRRGVEVRFVPVEGAGPSVDDIMARVDGRTRAVSCSAITWDTGYRIDLEDLGRRCAERGCLLIVDGIQAVGARRLDVKATRVSALATHAYKGLLAGFGLGALYIAPEALDRIDPTFVGAASVAGAVDGAGGDLDWKPGAARFQAGGTNHTGMAALAASLSLIDEVGIATIEERGRALADALVAGLRRKGVQVVSSPDPARRSAITVFTLGSHERDAALVEQLEAQGIIVALRPLGVRVSPHFYNTEEEIGRLLDALP